MLFLIALLTLLAATTAQAVRIQGVEIESKEGPFFAKDFSVEGKGRAKSLKVKWKGSATNQTGQSWYKVTFCIRAFGVDGKPLQSSPNEPCLLNLWMYNWQDGAQADWKGSQKVRVGNGGPDEVEIDRFDLSVKEILRDPESVRVFDHDCATVWPAAVQTLMDSKFRPTVSDKDTFVASFEYTGGRVIKTFGTTNDLVKDFTTAKIRFLTTWEGFRIDSASLMLRVPSEFGCRAEIKMTFAGFQEKDGWYELQSNHQYEKSLLSKIADRVSRDYEHQLDRAIAAVRPPDTAESSDRSEGETFTAEEEGWKEVARWRGAGLKNTEDFKISAKKWRIAWKADHKGPGTFQISVYSSEGDLVGMAANQQAGGEDTSYHRKPGEYFLQINAVQMDWQVVVQEQVGTVP